MSIITWRRYGLMGPPRKSLDIAMQIARVVSKAYSKPSKQLYIKKKSIKFKTSKDKRKTMVFYQRFIIKLNTKDVRKRFIRLIKNNIKKNGKGKYTSK